MVGLTLEACRKWTGKVLWKSIVAIMAVGLLFAVDSSGSQGARQVEDIYLPYVVSSGETITPPSQPSASLLLNEVAFKPEVGSAQYVELLNVGTTPATLSGAILVSGSGEYQLPTDTPQLAPGAVSIIVFDGMNRVDGRTIHADLTTFLNSNSDRLVLRDVAGPTLDVVSWGTAEAYGVRLGRGGFLTELPVGFTIGRIPGTTTSNMLDWLLFGPDEASRGVANSFPAVSMGLPTHGALLGEGAVRLDWYTVPTATGYRVQVARDMAFTDLAADELKPMPPVTVNLAEGKYYWRVQAQHGAAVSVYNDPQLIEIGQEASQSAHTLDAAQDNVGRRVLDIIPIGQQKDTTMLLLEGQEEGPHAWNLEHPEVDPNDPADNMNCALASVAMLNRYYGGAISQDRLGFEIFNGRLPGPERDLNYGDGTNGEQLLQAMAFALNTTAGITQYSGADGADAAWDAVRKSIDADTPMILAVAPKEGTGHAMVLRGYADTWNAVERRVVYMIDPAGPESYAADIDIAIAKNAKFFLIAAEGSVEVRDDEASIRMDSDGDGIRDFDEVQRFATNPGDVDSDGDDVNDYAEVRLSVFDPNYGYSTGQSGKQFGPGRDFDEDGLSMELDCDSDSGGANDGLEDSNHNGEQDIVETSVFVADDDDIANPSAAVTCPCRWSFTAHSATNTAFNGQYEGSYGQVFSFSGDGGPHMSLQLFEGANANTDKRLQLLDQGLPPLLIPSERTIDASNFFSPPSAPTTVLGADSIRTEILYNTGTRIVGRFSGAMEYVDLSNPEDPLHTYSFHGDFDIANIIGREGEALSLTELCQPDFVD